MWIYNSLFHKIFIGFDFIVRQLWGARFQWQIYCTKEVLQELIQQDESDNEKEGHAFNWN